MTTKLKYDKWKTQDIKNWKFDASKYDELMSSL